MARILKTLNYSPSESIDSLLMKEGMPYNYGQTWTGTIQATNQSVGLQAGIFSFAKAILNAKVLITSSKNVSLFYSGGLIPEDGNYSNLVSIFIPAGGCVTLDMKETPLSQWYFGLLMYGDATQVDVPVTLGLNTVGTLINRDFNFLAKKKIYWIGDSITDFTCDDFGMENIYQYQVRNQLMLASPSSIKNDCRLVNKGFSGITGVQLDNDLLPYGYLYIDRPDIIFYQMGVNDAAQAVGTSAYATAVNNMIAYKQRMWPNSILVMLGSTPMQDDDMEDVLITYRTAMENAVTIAADPKVIYINLENSFDRTADPTTIWAASDNPGVNTECLHPGKLLSHTGIATTIMTGLTDAGITI